MKTNDETTNLRERIAQAIIARFAKRPPDLSVGGDENPYMRRWYILPRNRFLNVYLHQFLRDDEDRACHDHPWISLSWLMRGMLIEVTDTMIGSLRAHHNEVLFAGRWHYRSSIFAHRLIVPEGYCGKTWTIFITGPRLREWGFHCPGDRWIHWRLFTEGEHGETVGKGCNQ